MPFAEGNPNRIKPVGDEPMTGRIDLRLKQDVADKIREIPDWRSRLRLLLEKWIENPNYPDLP